MLRTAIPRTLVALTLVAAWGASLGQNTLDPARVIATVNGEEVRAAEYYRRMEFLPGVGRMDSNNFFEAPPGFLTIEQLVTERLVLQLAKQKGVSPSEPEVEAELKARQADNPKLVEEWVARGRTLEELKQQVRYELAQFKISTFGITVTDQEVETHYRTNPTMYTVPKQVKLKVIVVDKAADRDAVDRELSGGKAFAEVARQYSIDASKVAGGDFGTVPLAFLNTPARSAIEAIKIGELTQWVTSDGGESGTRFLKFQLVDVQAERKLPLDDRLKRGIRRQLMMDRGRVRNDIRKEMAEMRAKAKVDIKQPEFAEIYKKFIDAYLRQTRGGQ